MGFAKIQEQHGDPERSSLQWFAWGLRTSTIQADHRAPHLSCVLVRMACMGVAVGSIRRHGQPTTGHGSPHTHRKVRVLQCLQDSKHQQTVHSKRRRDHFLHGHDCVCLVHANSRVQDAAMPARNHAYKTVSASLSCTASLTRVHWQKSSLPMEKGAALTLTLNPALIFQGTLSPLCYMTTLTRNPPTCNAEGWMLGPQLQESDMVTGVAASIQP